MSVDLEEIALLCALTGRPDPAPRVRDLPPAFAKLRDRVAVSMAQIAINQLRELGPTRPPTQEKLVRLMTSRDHDVRMLGMQVVRAGP